MPLTVDPNVVGATILTVALVALASFVLIHSPRATLNRRFGIMALTTAGWIITISLALAAKDPWHTVLLGRIGFAFASVIPFTLTWMVNALSGTRASGGRARLVLSGILCFGFVLASLSPWVVAEAVPGAPRANFLYGPLHRAFGIYFLLSFGSGLYALWTASKSASGITGLQLRYLLLGISLTGAGAITTNLLAPLLWKTSHYSALGPYFSLLFFSFSAHAIIRHRLMDVKVFVRKGVVYFSAILVSSLLFLTAATLTMRLSGHTATDSIPLTAAIAIAVVIALSFQPLKRWIQDSFNRYLYRETYDYQRTVREVSRRLSTILDLQTLLDYVAETIERVLRCESARLYLADDQRKDYYIHVAKDRSVSLKRQPPILSATSSLATFLRKEARALILEEPDWKNSNVQEAAQELKMLGGELAFPFLDENSLLGVLIVGPKLSGDPHFLDDIDLVSTLASQTAIAMKNAQLYRQVVLANEHIENIVETMESAVIAVTAEGTVTLFNSAAERLTGLKAANMKGRQPDRGVFLDVLPSEVAWALAFAVSGSWQPRDAEVTIDHGSTGRLHLILSTAVLHDDQKRVTGALVVATDLSAVKALERNQRRVEHLAVMARFYAGLAHEIRNPLAAISNFISMLPDRFDDPEYRDTAVRLLPIEVARIVRLADRLRLMAPSEGGKLSDVALLPLLNDIVAIHSPAAQDQRVKILLQCPEELPKIQGDPSQLVQLFVNLLRNAIEAMPDGGSISIEAEHVSTRITAERVIVRVIDEGPGIDPAVRGKIFEPFFTTKPSGTGLGLSICQEIADFHRARLTLSSRTSFGGTVAEVEFPCHGSGLTPA